MPTKVHRRSLKDLPDRSDWSALEKALWVERERVWTRNTNPQGLWAWVTCCWIRVWNVLFGAVFGFGHNPARALGVWVLLIVPVGGLNWMAFSAGQFAPNSDMILASWDWRQGVMAHDEGAALPLFAWQATET